MDEELSLLLDERAIGAVLLRYCRGIDRCDEELLRSVYHPRAYDDHSVYQGDAEGFVEFVLPMLRQAYVATQHTIHNCSIEVDGDHAGAETYCVAYHWRRDESAQMWVDILGCRYIDRFERRDGSGWRIAHRVVVHDWNISVPSAADMSAMLERATNGRRDENDLSYEVLAASARG